MSSPGEAAFHNSIGTVYFGGRIMNWKSFACMIVIFLSVSVFCSGGVVDITLDAQDWIVNDAHDWAQWTANYTKHTSPQGVLRIGRTVANGGTGWAVHLRTAETYAFTEPGMDYSVLRYKWRVNGRGQYSQSHGGPGAPQTTVQADPWLWGPTGRLTTGWTWNGSALVADDAWVFTELIIKSDRSWTATTGYSGYGAGNPLTSLGGTLSQSYYEAMGDTYFRHSLGDNYAAGQYVEIAEATIEVVPEPATLLLFGLGAVALRRRRR